MMTQWTSVVLLAGVLSTKSTADFAWTDYKPTLVDQCPYTAFCNESGKRKFPAHLQEEYEPCCSPCSCSAECGAVGNCCYKELDTIDNFDHPSTTCTLAAYGTSRQHPSGNHYHMITQCRPKHQTEGTGIINCLQHDLTEFGSVYPVSSPSSGFTFANKFCALCNGVTDVAMWNRTVHCHISVLQPDDIPAAIKDRKCFMSYVPPKGLRHQPETCEPDLIDRCNISGLWKTFDRATELGCQQVYAPYRGQRGEIASSIFCFKCNYPGKTMSTVCKTGSRWSALGVPLTILLNLDDVFDRQTDEDSTSRKRQLCVPAPASRNDTGTQLECLSVNCPEGKYRRGEDCLPSFDLYVNINKVDLALKLEYDESQRVSVEFIKAATDLDTWMTTIKGILPIDELYKFSVFYRKESNSQLIEYIGVSMSVLLSLPGNDWNEMLAVIQQAFQRQRFISIGNMSVPMNLSFFESPMACFNEFCYYKQVEGDMSYREVSSQAKTSGLTSYVFGILFWKGSGVKPGMIITQMMYCEQVELASDMFTEENYTVILKEWNVRVYPNQMKKIRKGNETLIRLCVDQLPLSPTLSTDTPKVSVPDTSAMPSVLGWLTLACTVLSALSLLLTIIAHLVNRELLHSQGGRNVITLCILLLIAQLLFTFGTGQTDTGVVCVVLGALVHLFWLSAVFWMFVCCVFIAITLLPTTPVTTHEPAIGKFVVSLLAVFGLAAVFVGINMAASNALNGQVGYGKELCYVDAALMRRVTFAVPIGVVVVCNVGMFIAVVMRLERDLLTIGNVRQTKDKLLIYARLSALTGMTWITGFVYHIEVLSFFQYIFVILNAGQGVFIFASFILRPRVLGKLYQLCIAKRREDGTIDTYARS